MQSAPSASEPPVESTKPQRLVFVDESIFGLFGKGTRDGNFAYAVVSLPASSTRHLEELMQVLEAHICREYVNATGKPVPAEIKSQHVRALPPDGLRTIAEKIAYFLSRHQGVLFGFSPRFNRPWA